MLRLLAVVTVVALLAGCGAGVFDRVAELRAAGDTVAVLAGINNEFNELAAAELAAAVARETQFIVLPDKHVRKVLAEYPANIRGPYRYAYVDIEPDFSRTDVTRLKNIAAKLDVNRILVVWAPVSSSTIDTTGRQMQQVQFISQMFEFPGGREVGRGLFGMTTESSALCLAPRPSPEESRELLRLTMETVAMRIGKTLNRRRAR